MAQLNNREDLLTLRADAIAATAIASTVNASEGLLGRSQDLT